MSDERSIRLLYLLHRALVELRNVSDRPQQVHDLADAIHNLPLVLMAWDGGEFEQTMTDLQRYHEKYPGAGDYHSIMSPYRLSLESILEHLPMTWQLWRQDDPGNVFLVATFFTEEEAEAERARYEAKGHHQHYWVARKGERQD